MLMRYKQARYSNKSFNVSFDSFGNFANCLEILIRLKITGTRVNGTKAARKRRQRPMQNPQQQRNANSNAETQQSRAKTELLQRSQQVVIPHIRPSGSQAIPSKRHSDQTRGEHSTEG